jgi:hypothetical protein
MRALLCEPKRHAALTAHSALPNDDDHRWREAERKIIEH